MRDLFLLAIMLLYGGFGLRAPFVFGLGYLWADYFGPQRIAFSFMSSVPVSLLMALAAFAGYVVTARKQDRLWVPGIWPLLVFAAWITLTTTWSVVPDSAWATWDWSFKTVCFAAFLPFLFKTRVQLEAFLLTIGIGLSGTLMAFGAKTLLGGGRYGAQIALAGGNSGLSEQGLLSCIAIAIVPIFIFMSRHSTIITNRWLSITLFYGLSAAAMLTAIGTFERTGLVAMAVLGLLTLVSSKRKVLVAAMLAAALATSGYFLSERWVSRMSTIQNYQGDESAMTRLMVWEWCWNYAVEHPWGGGFNVYETNHFSVPVGDSGKMEDQSGRAAHSMYFQIISEQGFPGAIIFGAIVFTFFRNGRRINRRTKDNTDLEWANSLSRTLMISGTVYLAGGAFQSIAFQPFFYDLVAAGVTLNAYTARLTAGERERHPSNIPSLATISR